MVIDPNPQYNVIDLPQAVTIRKAEAKGIAGSLLSKLHYGIVQMLDEASSILHSANKDKKDISTGFLVSMQISPRASGLY